MIRKSLHREYYHAIHDEAELAGFLKVEHLGRCVDALRQSLMCSADVSVVVWQRSNDTGRIHAHTDVAHTCRDFDRIREWAWRNRAVKEFDPDVRVEDDIGVPEIH
jgi:Mycotoxin biosynthesis protein UstYa